MNGRLTRDRLPGWPGLDADVMCDVLWSVMMDDPHRALILDNYARREAAPAAPVAPDPETWGLLPEHQERTRRGLGML